MSRKISFVVALAWLVVVASAPPAHAAVISYTNTGGVVVGLDCPPPPALPIDCSLVASGIVHDTSGTFGPWLFQSFFSVLSAGQPSPTQFLVTGTFFFDDPSAANNDLGGTLAGIFDVTTFSSLLNYTITSAAGAFAGAGGFGSGVVQIIPGPDGFGYVERGVLFVPEPATLAMVASALLVWPWAARRRRVA